MDDGSEGNGHPGAGALQRLANRVDLPLPERVFEASPPVLEAMSSLFDAAVDRLLSSSERVTSAAEGKRLLARDDGTEALADNVQRVAVLVVPVLRTFLRSARLTRVPWVLVATTSFSIGSAVQSGIREAQVICSLVAHRLERETGRPADPALVNRLALALYLDPRARPDVSSRSLPLGRVLRGWLVKGAIGRDTRRRARKALDAAERLDLRPYLKG